MFELNPEVADREDSRFWYVDRNTLLPTKPGDTVIVETVIGEHFGEYDRTSSNLKLAATFLGMFKEDEGDSIELAKQFIGEEEIANMSPEEIESLVRHPYFKAYFQGIGEIVFAGVECYWRPVGSY